MKKLVLWPFVLLVLACQPSADHDTKRTETVPPATKQAPSALPDTAAASVATASPDLPAGFREVLAAGRMTFRTPAGTVPTPVLKNGQMDYDYAVRVPGKHVEIRYAIRPLDQMLAEYQQAKAKGEDMGDPNELYSSLITVVALNISGGDEPTTKDFPAEAVRQEFGADWGTTTMVRAGKEFGPKYAKCMIVALHKKDAADAYCFYLFDKPEDLGPLLDDPTAGVFHALRFSCGLSTAVTRGLLARVCDALPPGYEPVARVKGRCQTRPPAVRARATGSNPVGSASQTRASNSPRNSR